jgi:hypothetical protein
MLKTNETLLACSSLTSKRSQWCAAAEAAAGCALLLL